MSEVLIMEQDVAEAFETIRTDIKNLSVQVGRLEQKNINGDKQEDEKHRKQVLSIGIWRICLSVIGVGMLVLQIMGMIK